MNRRRRIVLLCVCCAIGLYVLVYCVNSLRGGYELVFTSTLLHPVSIEPGNTDPKGGAIAWQPRYGRFTRYGSDCLGKFFCPLIFLDQALWHRDFPPDSFQSREEFKKLVPLKKVHPEYRKAYDARTLG